MQLRSFVLSLVAGFAFSGLAFAQNTVTLTPSVTQGTESITTTISWATNPPLTTGTPCTASGHPGWTGPKAGSGTNPPITIATSGTLPLSLTCNFPGDSIVTFSWTPPTQNTDGSPLTNLAGYRIKHTFNATLMTNPLTAAAGEVHTDVAANQTMRTITGISQTGTLRGGIFAQNTPGVFSVMSNVATKVFTGTVPVTQMVSITVNPRPNPPTANTAE
jgi:hypothetical protein